MTNTKPANRRKKLLISLAGWAVSLVCIVLVLRQVDIWKVGNALRGLSWEAPLIMVAIYLAGFVVRAVRTKLMLPALNWSIALGGVLVGYAANNILPFRLGEFFRAQFVGQNAGVSRTLTLSTIFVERVLDGIAIVGLLFLGSFSLPLPPLLNNLRWVGLFVFMGLGIGTILFGLLGERALGFVPAGKARYLATQLVEGVRLTSARPAAFILIVLLSFAVWTVEGLMFFYTFHAFGLTLPFTTALFVLGVVNLAVLIPSTPGNIGVFHWAALESLQAVGVSSDVGAAYGVIMHLAQILPVVVLGLLCLKLFGSQSLFALQREAVAEEE